MFKLNPSLLCAALWLTAGGPCAAQASSASQAASQSDTGNHSLTWMPRVEVSGSTYQRFTNAESDDLWSRLVRREWSPRSELAMRRLRAFCVKHYGLAPDGELQWVLRATPRATLPESAATELLIEAGMSEPELREIALLQPLRQAMMNAIEKLGSVKRLPAWLPWLLADTAAKDIVEGMGLPPLPPYAGEPFAQRMEGETAAQDSSFTAADPLDSDAPTQLSSGKNELASAAAWQAAKRRQAAIRTGRSLIEELRKVSGDQFHTRMRSLLEASNQSDFDFERALSGAFGLSQAQLLAKLKASAAAAFSGGEGSLQLTTQLKSLLNQAEFDKVVASYIAAPRGRALAVDEGGAWGIASAVERPIEAALKSCADRGGRRCRVMAIDGYVVEQPEQSQVFVQMSGYSDGSRRAMVEKGWLDLVRQSTAQFNSLLQEGMPVPLQGDVWMYVGVNEIDYARILRDDLKLPPKAADDTGQHSKGLYSPATGRIALKLPADGSHRETMVTAIRTSLHELTHALQHQLAGDHRSFAPRAWITEGSADLFAAMLGKNLRFANVDVRELGDLRLQHLDWLRAGHNRALSPDDVAKLSSADFTRLTNSTGAATYKLATLMCMYLQAITGDRFLPGWMSYYRSAGQVNSTREEAFEAAFGLSEDAFVADFKLWAAQQ